MTGTVIEVPAKLAILQADASKASTLLVLSGDVQGGDILRLGDEVVLVADRSGEKTRVLRAYGCSEAQSHGVGANALVIARGGFE